VPPNFTRLRIAGMLLKFLSVPSKLKEREEKTN